jgi:multicomponent Na+:H+ antiporter subunit C
MSLLLPALFGLLVAAAVYQLLSRHAVRLLLGLIILGNAANLAIFAAGRVDGTAPPLVLAGADTLAAGAANPLPQALILTAIVISFGMVVFALTLAWRTIVATGTVDVDAMRVAEPRSPDLETGR